jgi:hypothetical protein
VPSLHMQDFSAQQHSVVVKQTTRESSVGMAAASKQQHPSHSSPIHAAQLDKLKHTTLLSSRLLQALAVEHWVPAQALAVAAAGVEVVAAVPMLRAMPHQLPSGFPQLCQLQRCHQCKQVRRRSNPMPISRQLLFKQQQKLLLVSHQSWLRRL